MQTETRPIKELFSAKGTDFLIPEYQRAYSWAEDKCQTLWDDFCDFAFPDGDNTAFNDDKDEYFLGVIITFRNEQGQDEVVDGQQRLTTLLLLMRAFYQSLGGDDGASSKPIEYLGECIWKTDELGELDKSSLKINSEILREDAKAELKKILSTGTVIKTDKSTYAANYRFFQEAINDLKKEFGEKTLQYLPARIMNNCFLTQLRVESQDLALQMFYTLNASGQPLSTTDIFKAVMYKFYKAQSDSACEEFIERWQELERRAAKTFGKEHHIKPTPLEFLFNCYSYRNKDRANKNIRQEYEPNNYEVLRRKETLDDLFALLDFFDDLLAQNLLRFPMKAIRYAHILFRTKNVFVWFPMANYFFCRRNERNHIDGNDFAEFLERLLAFFLAHVITKPNTQALRGFSFRTLADLKNPVPSEKNSYTFSARAIKTEMEIFNVKRSNNLMKMLVLNWWTFHDENQELPPIEQNFDVEHIFPKSLEGSFESFTNKNSVNLLGNLALLEHNKNLIAARYRFADKRKVYLGYERNGKFQAGTLNRELQWLAQTHSDFGEIDIIKRNKQMTEEILAFVGKHSFLQD